jgi:hypothetical protein
MRLFSKIKSFSTSGKKIRKLKTVKIRTALFIFVIPLLVSGCASNEQFVHFPDQSKIVEDPGKGRIYLIRPKLAGIGISPDISDDGESIGSTSPRGFLCWERKPGDTTVSAKTDNTSEVTVNVKAGEVSYIFQTIHFGWINTDNRLDIVSEQEGRDALKKCKPPVCYLPSNTATNPATATKQ